MYKCVNRQIIQLSNPLLILKCFSLFSLTRWEMKCSLINNNFCGNSNAFIINMVSLWTVKLNVTPLK